MSGDWPQPGDEALVVRPYTGSRIGASITRTTVAKLTARDVVLANGTRFHRDRIDGSGRASLSGNWDRSDLVMPPSHPTAVRYLRDNDLANRTGQLRDACRKLENLAGGDARGAHVTSEAVMEVVAAYEALRDARRRHGFEDEQVAAGRD